MKLGNFFANIINNSGAFVVKHEPEILAGAGVALFSLSIVKTAKATVKAVDKVENKKKELKKDKLSPKETVQTVWKDYTIPAVAAIGGAVCVFSSVSVSKKRYALLATSYELVKDAAKTYKEKVIETIGEKKEKDIENKIAQDKTDKVLANSEPIVESGKGTLFIEPLTGTVLEIPMEEFNDAVRKAEKIQLNNGTLGVDEWFSLLNSCVSNRTKLPETDFFKQFGWSDADQGGILNIEWHPSTAYRDTPYERPCAVIDYDKEPESEYFWLNR